LLNAFNLPALRTCNQAFLRDNWSLPMRETVGLPARFSSWNGVRASFREMEWATGTLALRLIHSVGRDGDDDGGRAVTNSSCDDYSPIDVMF
jgi:hypothetical protein